MSRSRLEVCVPTAGENQNSTGTLLSLEADDPRFRLEGFTFRKTGEPFWRLPDDPALPDSVRRLSKQTSGGLLRFRTDSRIIQVQARLNFADKMDHMAMTATGGFDLYADKRFVGVTRCDYDQVSYKAELFRHSERHMREFELNFPLYSGIEAFRLQLEKGARIEAPCPRPDDSPIVFYGTSITQGACASRPGRCYTSILGRKLDRPVLNFGFSSAGNGEPAVINYLAGISNPALYVLDYQANAKFDGIKATFRAALDCLRAAHPTTPILTVSRIRWTRELLETGSDFVHAGESEKALRFQRDEIERRNAAGDRLCFFLDGSGLTGSDWHECLVDGLHPTDLGFERMAAGLLPVITDILRLK